MRIRCILSSLSGILYVNTPGQYWFVYVEESAIIVRSIKHRTLVRENLEMECTYSNIQICNSDNNDKTVFPGNNVIVLQKNEQFTAI